MIDVVIAVYLKYVQLKYGLQLFKAESDEDLLAADTFRQDTYLKYLGIQKLPQTPEMVKPEGLVTCWCLTKENKLVGTACLFDPTIITPYASYFFEGSYLDFDPSITFELTRVALDQKQQRNDNLFFLLLLFACYRETVNKGRSQWLVCTHKRLMNQKQRLGGEIEILSDAPKLSQQDCFQARYWSNNDLDESTLKGYRAYLIKCDKGITGRVFKKYIGRKIKNVR